jgi:anti-anti-sigma regulatory factor
MSDTINNDSQGLLSRLGQWFKPSPALDVAQVSDDLSGKPRRPKSDELDGRARLMRKTRVDLIRKSEFSELRGVLNHVMSSVESSHLASSTQVHSYAQSQVQQSKVRVQTREKIDTIEEQMSKSWYASSLISENNNPLSAASRTNLEAPTGGDSQRVMRVRVGNQVEDFAYPPDAVNAAIAYALGDNISAERILTNICSRRDRTDRLITSWQLRFELYLSLNKKTEFEDASVDFAGKFGSSPPVWLAPWGPPLTEQASLPDDTFNTTSTAHSPLETPLPAHLDLVGIRMLLREFSRGNAKGLLRLNWLPLRSIETHALEALLLMFQNFSIWKGRLEFVGYTHLKELLKAATKDARDPKLQRTYWLLFLQCIRLEGNETAFESASIDFCVSQEESAPQWMKPTCQFEALSKGLPIAWQGESSPFEVTRPFIETPRPTASGRLEVDLLARTVTLKDSLKGDIREALTNVPLPNPTQPLIFDCSALTRIDAQAAGHLLGFLRQAQNQQGEVHLRKIHRLVGIYIFSLGLPQNVVLSLIPL